MKFIAIATNRIINIAGIARAEYVDNGTRGVTLALEYLTGKAEMVQGDRARQIWAVLQDAVKQSSS